MEAREDPRATRSKDAILHAARQLLVDLGPAAVTHVQVAERAGVGRATVYRHWPRAADLLAEAMSTVPLPFFAAPTEPVKHWLRGELTTIARQLELDDVRVVATTLVSVALWDPSMDERRQTFARVLADRLGAALDEAAARGEVTLRITSSAAAALLLGPLFYRSTMEHAVADEQLLDASIDAVGTWKPAG